jgi:phosphopantetheine adenylyltransferase
MKTLNEDRKKEGIIPFKMLYIPIAKTDKARKSLISRIARRIISSQDYYLESCYIYH